MRDGGFGDGRSGLPRWGWFMAASLLAHSLALLALYNVQPGGHLKTPGTAPVIVKLFDPQSPIEPVRPSQPNDLIRPIIRRVPKEPVAPTASMRRPDVIDVPERPEASANTRVSSAALAPTALPDESQGPPAILRSPAIERLFDPGVIAQQAMGLAVSEHPGTGITFDTKEMMLTGYMGLLRDKIEGTWVYPRKAAEEGIYGDLIIRFAIRRDGRLASAKVLRTSGYALLDEAALKALRNAGPYWPLPEAYRDETLVVTGRFIYSLYGTYIR